MRGAAAGALAAAVWAACDPLLKRAFDTTYADSELFGLPAHVAAGAAFGHLFERWGGRTATHGVAAALAENTVLWPLLGVLDPALARDRRAFASASAGHALFGAVLGALLH